MEILGFGTYDSRRHPRVAVILEGLRAGGDRVAEVNAPLALSTAARVDLLRRPWRLPGPVGAVVRGWLALAAGVLLPSGRPGRRRADAVVVGYLGQFDVVLARLLFPSRRTPLVLDQLVFGVDTAVDRGVSGRGRLAALGALDRMACRVADLVLVDTAENATLVPAASRDKVVVVPVGAAEEWFRAGRAAAAPSRDAGPAAPLRAVFYGLYTPLQGAPVLGRALRLLEGHGVRVTMIGTGQDYAATRAAAGEGDWVDWLGWVDPGDLPGLVADHDVCLGIFGTTPKAARVVPNKVFQGAAAGCAVLTSDTVPQRRVLRDTAIYVPPGDPGAIASALAALAGDRDRLAALRVAATVAARAFTPERVVDPLRRRLAAYCGQA